MLNPFANESISFDAMTKQTPYWYSSDAKEIIRNVHNFCKQEKDDGLKYLWIRQRKGIPHRPGSARVLSWGQQEYYRVVDEARPDKKGKTRTAENKEGPTGRTWLGGSAEDSQRHIFGKENLTNTQ